MAITADRERCALEDDRPAAEYGALCERLHQRGFPRELFSALRDAPILQIGDEQLDPFQLHEGIVLSRGGLRVSIVEQLCPLSDAMRTTSQASVFERSRFWRQSFPVSEAASGCGVAALAECGALVAAVTHSRWPSYRFVVDFLPCIGAICVAWPLPPSTSSPPTECSSPPCAPTAAMPAKEPISSSDRCVEPTRCLQPVTRDFLDGHFMADSPLHRACQLLPLLSNPILWASCEEHAAAQATICDWLMQYNQRKSQALRAAETANTAHGGLPESASGRQVFLAWLARNPSGTDSIRASIRPSERIDGQTCCHRTQSRPESPRQLQQDATPLASAHLCYRAAVSSPAQQAEWTVFTDLSQVRENLRASGFRLVARREDADILWLGEHLQDFSSVVGGALINQFPHESCLTSKNLLSQCAAAAYGSELPWIATAFTLPHQLPDLVLYWQQHQISTNRSPLFILKPWCGSRSRGHVLLDDFAALCAVCCPAFGARLACRYAERPLLLQGRKWDARLYVAVKSLAPPIVVVSRHWYARLANFAYKGSPLYETQAHFTVSKYDGIDQDFWSAEHTITQFDLEYGPGCWARTWQKVRLVLAHVMRMLVERAPGGPFSSGQCRAVYGIDMLFATDEAWQASAAGASAPGANTFSPQPVLLEVNYSPDFSSVSKFHPHFVDELFRELFLGAREAHLSVSGPNCTQPSMYTSPSACFSSWERLDVAAT